MTDIIAGTLSAMVLSFFCFRAFNSGLKDYQLSKSEGKHRRKGQTFWEWLLYSRYRDVIPFWLRMLEWGTYGLQMILGVIAGVQLQRGLPWEARQWVLIVLGVVTAGPGLVEILFLTNYRGYWKGRRPTTDYQRIFDKKSRDEITPWYKPPEVNSQQRIKAQSKAGNRHQKKKKRK